MDWIVPIRIVMRIMILPAASSGSRPISQTLPAPIVTIRSPARSSAFQVVDDLVEIRHMTARWPLRLMRDDQIGRADRAAARLRCRERSKYRG